MRRLVAIVMLMALALPVSAAEECVSTETDHLIATMQQAHVAEVDELHQRIQDLERQLAVERQANVTATDEALTQEELVLQSVIGRLVFFWSSPTS